MRISDWSSDVCSSDLPHRSRADMDASVHAGKFHMAVELGAARRVGDPGARGHRLAGAERAQIVDLVPHPDPDIDKLVALGTGGVPMRDRGLLKPLAPTTVERRGGHEG